MCTVSWLFSNTGYQLFFNRDELISRQQAVAPSVKKQNHVSFIAPTDPDAGGTWISVNQYGTSLCLLNNYAAQAELTGSNWISRGQLVHELSYLADVAEVQNKIKNTLLSAYRPFDLLALSLNRHICQLSWDGFKLRVNDSPAMPITSSSFETEAVIASRLKQFAHSTSTDIPRSKQLEYYHASHLPERGAYSVCMHRNNGQTVSFSHIDVSSSQAVFNYYDGAPCQKSNASTTQLKVQTDPQPDVA